MSNTLSKEYPEGQNGLCAYVVEKDNRKDVRLVGFVDGKAIFWTDFDYMALDGMIAMLQDFQKRIEKS